MAQRYRHSIIIQSAAESQNNFGEVTEVWSTLVTCWASMENLEGGESFAAGSQDQVNSFIFETYYSSLVTTQCRINYGSRYFDIEAVENVGNLGRKMRIRAFESDGE